MALKCKKENNGEYHTLLSICRKDPARKRPAKTGLLKKFFAWIARGANQASIGKTSCPT